ncbi:MAG TPA: hypothetical protein VKV15_12050 [Bryobacteraceae bacterium]|nr:hypothetical protein [Bryobacteraceae bacterium]
MTLNRLMSVVAIAASLGYSQDISGDWQGNLKAGSRELRIILRISKGDTGEWKGGLLSIDQSADRGAGIGQPHFH